VAIVSNLTSKNFSVSIVNANHLDPTFSTKVQTPACDLTWGPDGNFLVVVQSDNSCTHPVGAIVQASPGPHNTTTLKTLASTGTNPAFQPLKPLSGG
jgi:hypothetical protein